MGIETPKNTPPAQFLTSDKEKYSRELQERAREKIEAYLQAGDKEKAQQELEQLNKDIAASFEEDEKGN